MQLLHVFSSFYATFEMSGQVYTDRSVPAVSVSASLSPDIAESSEPVPVGVSQLEGSPMDTSSPASGTQEEPAASSAPPNHMSQELSVSGDSGLTDRQTDAETG